jgi:oxazoline/thiazoline synthase
MNKFIMLEMFSKLRLIPGFHVQEMKKGSLMLLAEGDNYLIQNPLCIEIIKYLKNQENFVSLENILVKLQSLGISVSAQDLQQIMHELIQFPLVTSHQSKLPDEVQAFLFKLGVSTEIAEEKLKSNKVTVSSYSTCSANVMEEILKPLGIQIGSDGEFHILIVDDYLDNRIQAFSQSAQEKNQSWMLVKPHGRSLWIGPIFKSDPALATYESLALRLIVNCATCNL